jgi:hypothetical protein
MDTWEVHFREKSRRRWSRHTREKAMKAAILTLFFGAVAAVTAMAVTGVR